MILSRAQATPRPRAVPTKKWQRYLRRAEAHPSPTGQTGVTAGRKAGHGLISSQSVFTVPPAGRDDRRYVQRGIITAAP